jgi:probable HAF family extracellular repeat protein
MIRRDLVAVFVLAWGVVGSAGAQYVVIELPPLPEHAKSRALAVNNLGHAVGWSYDDEADPRAVMWMNGEVIDLGALGGVESAAMDINDANQVTGWAAINTPKHGVDPDTHAFIWHNGVMQDLGTSGGVSSRGYDINASGMVTGTSQVCVILPPEGGPPGPCTPVGNEYTFIYADGTMTDLGGLFASSDSAGFGINAAGQIAGQSITVAGSGQPRHATLWHGSRAIDLGTLGGFNSYGWDINDAGQVVGHSDTTGNQFIHAFLFDPSTMEMTDLGTMPTFDHTYAFAVNAGGQVVGEAVGSFVQTGFLYSGGVMQDLEMMLAEGAGWEILSANDINDEGVIAGSGLHDGLERGFLLVPQGSDCGPDLNCDGSVDGSDLGLLLAAWESAAATADLNADGVVNGADLGVLLAAWSG